MHEQDIVVHGSRTYILSGFYYPSWCNYDLILGHKLVIMWSLKSSLMFGEQTCETSHCKPIASSFSDGKESITPTSCTIATFNVFVCLHWNYITLCRHT